MPIYLDPKNDITFKKVFGQHKDVLISFLNALLPLKAHQQIKEIEYLNNEILPALILQKTTIVDIRCFDNYGRQFLVEMQMLWTESFEKRVFFNTCKAFSQQIQRGAPFNKLEPVYSLNIVNECFSKQSKVWYHHYKLTHQELTSNFMEGISFIFIELPNFIPNSINDKRITALWLRFLKDIKNKTTMIPSELLEVPEIAKAVEALKVSSYSQEELEKYEKYWDIISQQKSLVIDAYDEGKTDTTRNLTINLIQNTDFSNEKIASLVNEAVDWVEEIRKSL